MQAIRILCGFAGMMILTFILFSYEDEESGLQNWFVIAWTALSNKEKAASDRYNSFLHKLVNGVNRILDIAYGQATVSYRAFLASYAFCVILTCLLNSTVGSLLDFHNPNTIIELVTFAVTIILWIYLKTRTARVLLTIELLVLTTARASLLSLGSASFGERFFEYPDFIDLAQIIVIFPTFSEFISITLLRVLFRKAAASQRLRRTLTLCICGALTVPTTAISLMFLFSQILEHLDKIFIALKFNPLEDMFRFGELYGLWTSIVLIFFALVATVATVGRLIQAILPRIVYSVIKVKLLESRKGMAGLSSLLIGSAFPQTGDMIEKIAKHWFG